LFLGGRFTRIGPVTGGGVLLDGATGARDPRFPRVGGIVFAVLSDDAGGYYIGGRFRSVGGVGRGNLAHILPDGSVDPAFAPRLDREVLALAKSPDRLYRVRLVARSRGGRVMGPARSFTLSREREAVGCTA